MDAPICRTCGEKHWSRLCVTKPVTSVTKTVTPVTPVVTPGAEPGVPRSVAPSRLTALQQTHAEQLAEIERLTAEVGLLRDENAVLKQRVGRVPMTAAERQRKRRSKI